MKPDQRTVSGSGRALSLSTAAFAGCFAVWSLTSILGLGVREEFGLSPSQFGLFLATPVLTGAVARAILGAATDRLGG
ncbi:MAG TPA: MFS transporter, partial [Phenylobacterium sp.]